MSNIFLKKLIASYDYDSATLAWSAATNAAIDKHFNDLPLSKSKLDPLRLGSKSVFYAKLRAALLEKSGSVEVDGKDDFNALKVADQLRFQAVSRDLNTNKWSHQLEISTPVVHAVKMDDRELAALKALRNAVDTAKLRKNVESVDADALITLLLPALSNLSSKLSAIVSALLLATGRRTTEIMKTAIFYLGPNDEVNSYRCMFDGQLKQGLHATKPYEIELLAPFYLVKNALDFVRKSVDTKQMTTTECNEIYGKSLNNYLNKKANGLNPHALRAIYALITFEALPEDARPTLAGHVSRVLGHKDHANAAFYTRLRIINYKGPYMPEIKEPEVLEEANVDSTWVINGAADRKRVACMESMMLHRKRITASSTKSYGGGSMTVVTRVIANNKDKIDKYNASL